VNLGSPDEESEDDEEEKETLFVRFYRCPYDGAVWADTWSSIGNDKCPRCNCEIEPYKWEELE